MADNKVTIYDIATRAQVSVATVSRVLNGTASVAANKRARVLGAIREMDYQPNALARALTSRRTLTIGLMVPDVLNPYYASFVFEVEREAMGHGYSVLLCNTMDTYLPGSRELEMVYMRTLADKRVDGAILVGGSLDSIASSPAFDGALARMRERIPVVLVSETYRDPACPVVYCDKAHGIAAMIEHLSQGGHKTMGFIAGRADIEQTSVYTKSFLRLTQEHGVRTKPEWIIGTSDTMEAGAAAGSLLLSRGEVPSAIVAVNDMVAIGCLYACNEAGLCVPNDVAIAGCDNISQSMYTYPRLTTIDLHIAQVAKEAIASLLGVLDGRVPQGVTVVRPDLIIRESSLPSARGGAADEEAFP